MQTFLLNFKNVYQWEKLNMRPDLSSAWRFYLILVVLWEGAELCGTQMSLATTLLLTGFQNVASTNCRSTTNLLDAPQITLSNRSSFYGNLNHHASVVLGASFPIYLLDDFTFRPYKWDAKKLKNFSTHCLDEHSQWNCRNCTAAYVNVITFNYIVNCVDTG